MFLKSKLLLAGAVTVLSFAGCASSGRMIASDRIPSAEATVKTGKAANNNTAVSVSVQHMAAPPKVQSGATTYVVWAKPMGSGTVQNLGALQVDKKLNGTLNTVLPFDTFKLFITAEPSAQVTEPTGQALLEANVMDGRAG